MADPYTKILGTIRKNDILVQSMEVFLLKKIIVT